MNNLFKNKEKIFIPYITAGDPNLKTTENLVYTLEKAGASLIELGVPFSDPLADGPTIQRSHIRSLNSGTNLEKIINTIKNIRKKIQIPIVLMSSINPILAYGIKEFAKASINAGVNGVIIPDLPADEGKIILKILQSYGLNTILLIAPTSSPKRIKLTIQRSTGFVYLVSITGVTGTRNTLPSYLNAFINSIKRRTKKQLAVGFGISNHNQVKQIWKLGCGVIVGSAIVKIIEDNQHDKKLLAKVEKFVKILKEDL